MIARHKQTGDFAGGLEVWAPAKLNLFLDVLAKRDDGFHEIVSLMVPVAWFDTIYFKDDPRGQIFLGCEASVDAPESHSDGATGLPEGTDNLIVRAIEHLRRRVGVSRGARLGLFKRIPLAAGLAGGSSDAAAVLRAARIAWRLPLSDQELAAIAAELGSDIPFFLADSPAVARGRGEWIEPVALPPLHLVIVAPPQGLSTAEVYRACRPSPAPREVAPLLDALVRGDLTVAGGLLHNALRPAAERLSPWIERVACQFAETDVLGHQMSGSGTSYFGLCRGPAHALRVAGAMASRGLGRVRAVQTTGNPLPA